MTQDERIRESKELDAIFENVPILFGLQAQGKVVIIRDMLNNDATWEEIGEKIGWCPKTAQEHYERILAAEAKAKT